MATECGEKRSSKMEVLRSYLANLLLLLVVVGVLQLSIGKVICRHDNCHDKREDIQDSKVIQYENKLPVDLTWKSSKNALTENEMRIMNRKVNRAYEGARSFHWTTQETPPTFDDIHKANDEDGMVALTGHVSPSDTNNKVIAQSGYYGNHEASGDGNKVFQTTSSFNQHDKTDDENIESDRTGINEREGSYAYRPHTLRELWSPWTACSASCGVGRVARRRRCGVNCYESESHTCYSNCKRRSRGRVNVMNTSTPLTRQVEVGRIFPFNKQDINSDEDHCGSWIECRDTSLQIHVRKLRHLPSCPCYYPLSLNYDNRVWDSVTRRYFLWRDVSFEAHLRAYKPGARYCILSSLLPGVTGLAAQHCCYDNKMKLITRGRDAGTPNLISPDLSRELHKKVDLLPWIICKGDWSRYNKARPPNNRRRCSKNPGDEELLRQFLQAKDY